MSASFALPDVTARSAAIRLADSAAQSFTFVPYVRVGAAAGIRTLVGAAPGRAEMAASLRLDDGVEGGVTVPAPRIYVRGPGDVIGIDAAQIIRRHPVPGTGNAPTGDLVSRVGTDTTLLYAVLTQGLADSLGNVLIFVGAIVAMLVIDPLLLASIIVVIGASVAVVGALAIVPLMSDPAFTAYLTSIS